MFHVNVTYAKGYLEFITFYPVSCKYFENGQPYSNFPKPSLFVWFAFVKIFSVPIGSILVKNVYTFDSVTQLTRSYCKISVSIVSSEEDRVVHNVFDKMFPLYGCFVAVACCVVVVLFCFVVVVVYTIKLKDETLLWLSGAVDTVYVTLFISLFVIYVDTYIGKQVGE